MDLTKFVALAERMIAENGVQVTFRLPSGEGAYNPIAGTLESEDTQVEAMAVLTRPDEKALSTATIHIGDMMLLVDGAGLPQAPDEKCTVIVQGEEWQVVAVSRVAPAGFPILFKVYIHKA